MIAGMPPIMTGDGRRRLMAGLIGLVVMAAAVTGFFAYIGYLGGPVITLVAPTGSGLSTERGTTILFLSSDMGPRIGMGRSLIQRFADDGLPVVTINCLTYFRHERTAADAERLLEAGVRRALAVPGTRHLILVGQSFGGDMLQASIAYLPDRMRQKIAMAVLVVPPDTTLFRASPAEIFSFGETGTPARPTARALDGMPVLCIHGVEESDSLCPQLGDQANVTRIGLPGGHMLDFDDDRLFAAIAPRIRQALAQPHPAPHYE